MPLADELWKLEDLRRTGALTDEEFAAAKGRLLNAPPATPPLAPADPFERERDVNQWATFVHLSLLAGFVVPLGGFVAPVVLWQIKKDRWPEIDAHGKVVVNWLISKVIYAAVFGLLSLIAVGIPLLIALGVVAVVFPVIGAVKAGKGELWRYPLSITFLT